MLSPDTEERAGEGEESQEAWRRGGLSEECLDAEREANNPLLQTLLSPHSLLTILFSPQGIHLPRALTPGLSWPESLASATGLILRRMRRAFP